MIQIKDQREVCADRCVLKICSKRFFDIKGRVINIKCVNLLGYSPVWTEHHWCRYLIVNGLCNEIQMVLTKDILLLCSKIFDMLTQNLKS